MALSIKDQLQIKEIKVGGIPISELVIQGVCVFASGFLGTTKAITYVDPNNHTTDEDNAAIYLSKMTRKATEIINIDANRDLKLIVFRQFTVLVGAVATSLAQVQSATEAQVEAFISGQAKSIIENMAGVIKQEKDSYNNV